MEFLLPLALFGLLGLMMLSGRKKQRLAAEESQRLQDGAVPGARIMTSSGLHGTVSAVADDTIELEIAPGVFTTWARAAVRDIIVPILDEDAEALDGETSDDESATALTDSEEPDQSDRG